MKKKFLKFILIFILSIQIFSINYTVFWASWDEAPIKVVVTERIPWAPCSLLEGKDWGVELGADGKPTWRYECLVPKWADAVNSIFWKMLQYAVFLVSLTWVLYIIINWILYSMWWLEASLKDESKKRIQKSLIWLVMLILIPVILAVVAPWIYK